MAPIRGGHATISGMATKSKPKPEATKPKPKPAPHPHTLETDWL